MEPARLDFDIKQVSISKHEACWVTDLQWHCVARNEKLVQLLGEDPAFKDLDRALHTALSTTPRLLNRVDVSLPRLEGSLHLSVRIQALIDSTLQNRGWLIWVEAKPPPAPFLATSKARILVVEDISINRNVMKIVLQRMGAEVHFAESGTRALNILSQDRNFDLILMDCLMPEMDGFATTRKIRNDLDLKSVPIVALSALGDEKNKTLCFESGMNDFMEKPVHLEDISRMLERWLPGPARAGSDLEPSLLESLVRLLPETAHRHFRALLQGIAEWDYPTMEREAHALKSSVIYLGAHRLCHWCTQLERAAQRRDSLDAETASVQVRQLYLQFLLDLIGRFPACAPILNLESQ